MNKRMEIVMLKQSLHLREVIFAGMHLNLWRHEQC